MMPRRLIQLFTGLVLYGFSVALMIRAGLGLGPWSVFHQGLAGHVGISIGLLVNIVGALLLLIWIPLRQKPGIGTIANVLIIGTATDLGLLLLPEIRGLPLQAVGLVVAVALTGLASALYIGAGLGPGPRDGLMTGIVSLTGWPVGRVRTGLEVVVLLAGWLLGGVVGVGTLLFAFAIGPLVQAWLPAFTVRTRNPPETLPLKA